MAWQDSMIPIVRAFINDFDSPVTYTDGQLEEFIVIAAFLVNNEIDFATTYTITINEVSISPDPVTNNDPDFQGLVALQAACIILKAEVKKYGLQNVRVTDAGSTLDLSGVYQATKDTQKLLCEEYARAKLQYKAGDLGSGAQIITTPTTNDRLPPNRTWLN